MLNGAPSDADFKRTRVIARQTYVFSHAALMGWDGGEACAHDCYRTLTKCWQGPLSGWARTLAADSLFVKDAATDLYDTAFALFALCWYYRLTRSEEALKLAHETLDFIDARMRHPNGKGFLHVIPAVGWRQQNPHMHLLEAALVGVEACGHARFADLARELIELFRTYFFDAESASLFEYFTEDWARAPGADGALTEPGHQFEWAWILGRASSLLGMDLGAEAKGLVYGAETKGVSSDGLTYNTVTGGGEPIDLGSRTWPNTERIKGHIAMFEMFGADPRPAVDSSVAILFQNHLAHAPNGAWIDLFDANRQPLSKQIPTSTLYHLFLAFAEIMRVGDRLRALP